MDDLVQAETPNLVSFKDPVNLQGCEHFGAAATTPWAEQTFSSCHWIATWGIWCAPSAFPMICPTQPEPRCGSIRPLKVGSQGPTSTLKLEYSLTTLSSKEPSVLGFLAMSWTRCKSSKVLITWIWYFHN